MIDLPPQTQIVCLAQAAYSEARGEGSLGQRAVIHVVLNRAKKRKMSACQVIRQPGQFVINYKIKYSGKDWKKIYALAEQPGLDPTGGAQYFHNKKVRPGWGKYPTTVIGNHLFYK